MLTRSQKKRMLYTSKDESCPMNSNQTELYSPAPACNPPVKVEEMGTMEYGGTSQACDGSRTDYLQVAWLLREKLSDLVDGDNKGKFEPRLGELQGLLDMAASRNIVSVDPKMLNPALWRTLPKELLLHVFARLPVPEIIRLRSLSREWKRDMTAVNSDIIQVCAEARPIMVAGVSCKVDMREEIPPLEYFATISDLSTNSSQRSFRLHPGKSPSNGQWNDTCAFDGGLICFVSAWKPSKANPLCIIVMNILTQVQRQLPPLLYVYSTLPQMVHIEVDSTTKYYRVVVIGKNRKDHPLVEVYDSGTRLWTKATPPHGFISGLTYTWQYNSVDKTFRGMFPTPIQYDFAERQLRYWDDFRGSGDIFGMTIWKDFKFVLHMNIEGHCVTKYCLQTNAKDWVEERSYLSSPLEDTMRKIPWSKWTLKACEGFLMVSPNFYKPSVFWFLDLFTGKWSGLLSLSEQHDCKTSTGWAFWNAVP